MRSIFKERGDSLVGREVGDMVPLALDHEGVERDLECHNKTIANH